MIKATQADKTYIRLIKRMWFIEIMGDILYKTLAEREKDLTLKNIYTRLAENERSTAFLLENELESHAWGQLKKCAPFALRTISFFIHIIPHRFLSYLLRLILKRRIYSAWFKVNKARNPALWQSLLDHEELQHNLLKPNRGNPI